VFIIYSFIFIFGITIGSFLNALIYRIPREINIAFPRSSCPSCKKVILWYENIPILSYLFLKGRCSGCQSGISIRYPLVELSVGIFATLWFPREISWFAFAIFLLQLSIFCSFLVHFFIDLDFQILPDSINMYLALVLFIRGVYEKGLIFSVSGGLIGFIFPFTVSYLFLKIRKVEGLGGGDIKLWGALGLFLGPLGIAVNIFLSCLLGSITALLLIGLKKMDKDTPLPFGPFIIVVSFLQMFIPSLVAPIMSYIT